jgi:biopolymer transport protein ExbB
MNPLLSFFLCDICFAADKTTDRSALVNFLITDFWISWPMILMSLAGLMCVIWRLLLNFNAKTDLNEFLPTFQEKLKRDGPEAALKYCKSRSDIIPKRLFVPALETRKQGISAMRRAMANAIELEIIPDLNFILPMILAIAKIAPMVGLFGTVVSMINTFQAFGQEDAIMQGKKIGLALFATAAGLITAIPLVFSHVLMKAWVAKYELKMKSAAQKLLILMQNYQESGKGDKGEKEKDKDGDKDKERITAKQPGMDPRDMSQRR